MQRLAVLALTLAALSATRANAAPDVPYGGRGGPWCAYYDPYSYNCGFATLAQCRATISGAGGICQPNPYGAPVRDDRRHWRTRRY